MRRPPARTEIAKALREHERRSDYSGLIAELRERVADDCRSLTDPWVKWWCGLRWRNLLIADAVTDPAALKAAGKLLSLPGRDKRPARQRIAERFLTDAGREEWQIELPEPQLPATRNATLVFCPGLINGLLPVGAFQTPFPAVERKLGWRILRADAHPVRGCDANVADLRSAVEHGAGLDAANVPIPEKKRRPPRDVILLGYSKGTPDALTLLAARPQLAKRVKAVFCWVGAAGGSYLADDMYNAVKDVEIPIGSVSGPLKAVMKLIAPVVQLGEAVRRLDEYDVKTALRDLTTDVRASFVREHGSMLDALDVPIFNVTAATRATEVPYFQLQGYMQIAREDRDNDMQLTQAQARVPVPMATHLAKLHAHHWDVTYDPFPVRARLGSPNLDHPFPKEAAITATLCLAGELGLID